MNATRLQRILTLAVFITASLIYQVEPVAAKHIAPVTIAERGTGVVTDGEYVIWVTYPEGDILNGDIYGARLDDGEPFPIATGPASQHVRGIDNGIVVWEEEDRREPCDGCPLDIRGKNLTTGEELAIATTAADEIGPSISGNLVAWEQADATGRSIRVRDLSIMSEPTTVAMPRASGGGGPIIDGDRVVWEEVIDGSFSIFTRRIGDEEAVLVGSGSPIGAGASFGFDVAGDSVVFIDALWNMVVTNMVTGETRSIPISSYDQDVTFDGRYIAWQDHRADWGWGLRGYDLRTDSDFTIVSNGTNQSGPELQDGTLVWVSGDTTGTVMAAPFRDLLPSAPISDPQFTDDNGAWFSETGHTLSWGFKAFWERSGGLSVFGYPLTEEYRELNQDAGVYLATQYFERQRFEWHPEYAGTPYDVLLGRLGYEDAVQRKLLTAAPFLPVAAGSPSNDCAFFQETEHRVCNAFLRYWQGYGLDLGDAGVSYRESLALFGFPLSEPYTDPDTGLTIQYFERAIFELHPENDEPYRVLLRRLGAEEVTERGWS